MCIETFAGAKGRECSNALMVSLLGGFLDTIFVTYYVVTYEIIYHYAFLNNINIFIYDDDDDYYYYKLLSVNISSPSISFV